MAATLRQADTVAEAEIARFLDTHFYPHFVKNQVRFKNIEEQMQGLDIIFDYGELNGMLVDEKAAAHYVNKDLPTFAFEVNFLRLNGQLVEGWFFDKSKLTQYYLLAWVWATKDKHFTAEDITKLDVLIANRQSIIEMLATHGLTYNDAVQIATELRNKGEFGAFYKSGDKPFYFFYSPQLAEKPVNIIIKKSALLKLGVGRHIITR